MKRLTDQTLYELLEVPPDAPPDDLRAAIERAREIFGPGSLAMYSLMSSDEASLVNRRIEEAWATLLDPEARARYDATLKAPKGEGATAQPVAPWTAAPVIPARAKPAREPAPAVVAEGATPAGRAGERGPEADAEARAGEALAGRGAESRPGDVAHAAEPEVEEDDARVDDGPGIGAAAEAPVPPGPARAPLLLVQPVGGPSGEFQPPTRAPIRLEKAISVPTSAAPSPQAPGAPPPTEEPTPSFGEDTPWTGEMLRKVREARGLPLLVIAERTKVTRHHLENIEGDRYSLLPAPVYLRGILLGLARELRLDGQKVARSYLERMAAASPPPPPSPGAKR